MRNETRPQVRERFGFAFKDRTEAPGQALEELAEQAHIHRTYLSDDGRGTKNLSPGNIEKGPSGLSLEISELFGLVEQS